MSGGTGVHEFTTKPRTVRAVQWAGDNIPEIRALVGVGAYQASLKGLVVRGGCYATKGDWVVVDERDQVEVFRDDRFREDFTPHDATWCEVCGGLLPYSDESAVTDVEGCRWHAACDYPESDEPLGGAA